MTLGNPLLRTRININKPTCLALLRTSFLKDHLNNFKNENFQTPSKIVFHAIDTQRGYTKLPYLKVAFLLLKKQGYLFLVNNQSS